MTRYDRQNIKYKVINPGKTYSTYESWIRTHFPEYFGRFKSNTAPRKGEILRKIGEAPHRSLSILPNGETYILGSERYIICLFENISSNNIYIIDNEGVEQID